MATPSTDLAVLKISPHPNVVCLFIQHFLSMESQLIYANAWMSPVVKGRRNVPMGMRGLCEGETDRSGEAFRTTGDDGAGQKTVLKSE